MLDQATYWLNIVGTAADALLLGRVLLLKLHRIYLYITLACVLALLFDGVDIWLWSDLDTRLRVFLYSRFLFACVYPLVGWDVFEEMKPQILKLRRIAIVRLVSGLLFATILGFLVSLFVAPSDGSGQPMLLLTLGLIVWAGSAAATLGFLWTLRRTLRAQSIARPNNTSVWMAFWQLVLLAEIISCFTAVLKKTEVDIADLVLTSYVIVVTAWCILKLRAIPSDVPSTPINADSTEPRAK